MCASRQSQILSVSVINAASVLEIDKALLSKILGISENDVGNLINHSYVFQVDSPEWENALRVITLVRALFTLVGENEGLVKAWFSSPNNGLGNRQPSEVLAGHNGLRVLGEYVEKHLNQG